MDGWMDGWMQQPLDRQLTMLSVSFSKQRWFVASVFAEMLTLHVFFAYYCLLHTKYVSNTIIQNNIIKKKQPTHSFITHPFLDIGSWYSYILRLQFAFAISCGIHLSLHPTHTLALVPFVDGGIIFLSQVSLNCICKVDCAYSNSISNLTSFQTSLNQMCWVQCLEFRNQDLVWVRLEIKVQGLEFRIQFRFEAQGQGWTVEATWIRFRESHYIYCNILCIKTCCVQSICF